MTLAATRAALAAALLLGLHLSTAPASAQSVTGAVLEEETRRPVVGAMVILVDEHDQEHAQALTDGDGRYTLRASDPGRYAVRTHRIGRRTVTSPFLDLGADEVVEHVIEAPAEAVTLEGVTVEGEGRCHLHPAEGQETARLWEEARQVLEREARSRDDGIFRYRLRNYERRLDPDGGRVLSEESRPTGGHMRQPFVSAPVEELLDGGWVRDDEGPEGGWIAFAPDATALLSDAFMDAHCFRLHRDAERPGMVGLAFEPVERPRRPAILGTLWLDELTAELRLLTFHYSGLPTSAPRDVTIPRGALGGEVEFMGLPDGSWVVSRWHLRLPELALREERWGGTRQERVLVVSIHEGGGEVLEVRRSGGETVARPGRARVEGAVRDAGGEPLPGAVAYLEGTAYEGRTDSRGRFVLSDLPEGRFHLTFRHPSLVPGGPSPDPVPLTLEPDARVEVDLAVPSEEEFVAEVCSFDEEDAQRLPDPGLVVGRVTDAVTGEPVAEAEVRLEDRRAGWVDDGGGVTVARRSLGTAAQTDAEGRFRVCALPAAAWGPEARFVLSVHWQGTERLTTRPEPNRGAVVEANLEIRR